MNADLLSSVWQFFCQRGGELSGIVGLSLMVSGSAVIIGAVLGVPLGAFLGLKRFPGRELLLRIIYTLMSLPGSGRVADSSALCPYRAFGFGYTLYLR